MSYVPVNAFKIAKGMPNASVQPAKWRVIACMVSVRNAVRDLFGGKSDFGQDIAAEALDD